ncbi:MAG: twin-arginine translocase TatA/TatE family subunit [Legionellales bacterium]|nr:twin-arginine translocase TatA/TatE family subunit [Legionellales bacterium]
MLHGISPLSLILIFLIVLVLFGAKRLRNIGQDLGAAVKSFRQGTQETDSSEKENKNSQHDNK